MQKKMLNEADYQRRLLLNEVQSLKGNIQVVARIRPSAFTDGSTNHIVKCSIDGMGVSVEGSQQSDDQKASFSFNRVFAKESKQSSIFEEVSPLIQSAVDGFQVCLFCYGQSKSGKTWTMLGDYSGTESKGIIIRSVENIFSLAKEMSGKGWSYEIDFSCVEIQNEIIRDLLATDLKVEKSSRHDILHRNNNIVLTGVRKVRVEDVDSLVLLIGETLSNHQNLYSNAGSFHTVYSFNINGRNSDKNAAELAGSLTFCDLGSCNAQSSSAAPVDQSLANLLAVFKALAQKTAQIPFRSSVLTNILTPCLSGDGKTLMIVNVTPDEEDYDDTLSSLKFAQMVNKIELGKPKRAVRETNGNAPVSNRGRNNSQ